MRVLMGIALGALAALLLESGVAEAAPPSMQVYSFRGLGGWASLAGISGCRSESINISASESVVQGQGNPPTPGTPSVTGNYSWFDFCTFQNGSAYFYGSEVALGGNGLQRLTFQGSVPITECSVVWLPYPQFICTTRTLTFDLALEANDQLSTHGQSSNHYADTYGSIHTRSVGSYATADVSGALRVDGVDIVSNPFVSTGSMGRTLNGSVTIYRYN